MGTINNLYQQLQDLGYLKLADGTFSLPKDNRLGSAVTTLLGNAILFQDGKPPKSCLQFQPGPSGAQMRRTPLASISLGPRSPSSWRVRTMGR